MLFLNCSHVALAQDCSVSIHVEVPPGTGPVYLAGNCPELGDWNARGLRLSGTNTDRTTTIRVAKGTSLEFKVTLGSWDHEALDTQGRIPPNHKIQVDGNQDISLTVPSFRQGIAEYMADWRGSGVQGTLIYWTNVTSKFLRSPRPVEIWLPPDYDAHSTNRYDVIYMHDGQNLFDPRLASTGVDWGVDEAVMRCRKAGELPPVIVVGVWCTDQRLKEYSPWHLGTNYARFLIEELMPRVNREFRTRTGPEHTAVMGSSMGGLISFWLCWRHPEVFGRAGCLSSSFGWHGQMTGQPAPEPYIERALAAGPAMRKGVRIYMDYGSGTPDGEDAALQERVAAWLGSQGLQSGKDYTLRVFPGAQHTEAAWRTRLDTPLAFLYAGWKSGDEP